jgi:methylisocitrate lyase
MAWLLDPPPSPGEAARRLRARLSERPILQVPGAPDPITALLAREAGFEALYLSGAAVTASLALPDLGLLTHEEMARRAGEIAAASRLPLIVDIDTGYGGVWNVARAAKAMAAAGAAAIQIEDQEMPKRCGHLEGKRLVPWQEMAAKVRAAKETSPDLLVVARTDAYAVEGLDGAVERALRYVEAGADVIFPEALPAPEEFRRFRAHIGAPLLANMTEFGKTPYLTAQDFEALGYALVIYPVSALRIALYAVRKFFATLRAEGTQVHLLPEMLTREELYRLIGYDDYPRWDEALARAIAALPAHGGDRDVRTGQEEDA